MTHKPASQGDCVALKLWLCVHAWLDARTSMRARAADADRVIEFAPHVMDGYYHKGFALFHLKDYAGAVSHAGAHACMRACVWVGGWGAQPVAGAVLHAACMHGMAGSSSALVRQEQGAWSSCACCSAMRRGGLEAPPYHDMS